jgi:hypothetical protein
VILGYLKTQYPHRRPFMPLAFTDSQLQCVQDTARNLPPWQRSAFLQQLAEALDGKGDIGDGELHRACRWVAAEMARKRPGRLASALFGRAG